MSGRALRGRLTRAALGLSLLAVAAGAAFLSHRRQQEADRALAGVSAARPGDRPARLRYKPECVLQAVAERKGRALDPAKPLPRIRFESQTPLKDFQDAVETQWGSRPEVFTNAYSLKTGEIFLIDEAAYYRRLKRHIDDSLAHEYAHYLQVVYDGADLMNDPWGSYEADAIDLQTWFRTDFYPVGPTPACRP